MRKRHKILSRAAAQRAQLAHRAYLIDLLGMKPERSQAYDDRYAATSGELQKWAREAGRSVKEWTDFLTPAEREAYREHGTYRS